MRSISKALIVGICLAIPLAPAVARSARTSPTPPVTTTSNNPLTNRSNNPATNQSSNPRKPGRGVTTTQVVTPPPACAGSLGSFSPAANACYGFVSGNVLDSSATDVGIQTAALASLGLTFTNFNDYLKITPASGATFLSFGQPLYGDTVIGIHFGNGSGVGNSTGFFRFDFASSISGITLNIPAVSDVVLYKTTNVPTTAVPEPATWATMLLGFGVIGFAARRRRKRASKRQVA